MSRGVSLFNGAIVGFGYVDASSGLAAAYAALGARVVLRSFYVDGGDRCGMNHIFVSIVLRNSGASDGVRAIHRGDYHMNIFGQDCLDARLALTGIAITIGARVIYRGDHLPYGTDDGFGYVSTTAAIGARLSNHFDIPETG